MTPRSCLALPSKAALLLALGALGFGALGCQTYRQDLDRAEKHYAAARFESSLALLRVLERDLGALSPAEQARYAYCRGMTDYRLAAVTVRGTNVADPQASFRAHSRHWLSLARALEQRTPGSLDDDKRSRLDAALAELDEEVHATAKEEALRALGASPRSSDSDEGDDSEGDEEE